MTKPTRRVLAALDILQAQGRATAGELAERLGVDRRTARRYVTHLVELGLPIDAERGRDGGYVLRPGFKLPPMMFGPEETVALALGLRATARLDPSGLGAAAAGAQAKLERVLARAQRESLGAIDQSLALDLRAGTQASTPEALAVLATAARRRQRVRLRHRATDGTCTERDFEPYGVAFRGGAWYTAGRCRLRESLRSFRLDRVEYAVPLPESFGRPADFDLLDWLTRSVAALPRAHSVQVHLHSDIETARRHLHPDIALLDTVESGVRLRAQVDSLDWMARVLAGLPFAFTIEHPQALRDAVAAHANGLLALVTGRNAGAAR